jgi:WSTF, HB1, Itc1p, MBD9 motif 1
MEKVVKISKSFEECDRADKAFYQSLTPQERLKILWELNRRLRTGNDGRADERLERVYRIVKIP